MSNRRKEMGAETPIWRPRTITSILQSETILGWKCEEVKIPGKKYGRSQAILTAEGKIRMADPILSEEEWQKLQEEMQGATQRCSTHYKKHDRLSGGRTVWRLRQNLYLFNPERQQGQPVYRCNAAANRKACGKGYSFRAERVRELVEKMILGVIGEFPMHERLYVKGSSNSQRLREIETYVQDLQQSVRPGGRNSAGFAKQSTEAEIAALFEEHDALSAEGDKPDRYEFRPTGQTFADMWRQHEGNEGERTRHLLKAGITIRLAPHKPGISNTLDFGADVDLGNLSEPFTVH